MFAPAGEHSRSLSMCAVEMQNQPIYRRRRLFPRQGMITLELLLNLPIWLLLIFAVAEFGSISSHAQQISLASRVGAEEAAHTPGLPSEGEVPSNICTAVEHQLMSSGLRCSKVIVEHNTGGRPAALVSGNGLGGPPRMPLPSAGAYVRVSVFVRGTDLAPNLLAGIGFDVSKNATGQSTTFSYQLPAMETRR